MENRAPAKAEPWLGAARSVDEAGDQGKPMGSVTFLLDHWRRQAGS